MASVTELKKSFFAEIDKVENREHLEKLRVKYLGRASRTSKFKARLAAPTFAPVLGLLTTARFLEGPRWHARGQRFDPVIIHQSLARFV